MTNEYFANRYGKTEAKARNQRIFWISVGSTLFALFLIWSLSVNFGGSTTLSATVKNFNVVSAQQAIATISIANPGQRDGNCVVKVLSENFGVVGYKEVAVAGGLGANADISSKINTISKGVSVTVDRCWLK